MTLLLILLGLFVVDVAGCVLALDARIPYKTSYWIPVLGGWIALWDHYLGGDQ